MRKKGKIEIEEAKLENKKYWIWLSMLREVGNISKKKLLDKYKTPEIIYTLTHEELSQLKWLNNKKIENILDKKIRDCLGKYIENMIRKEIDIITINERLYPKRLKEIYDAPVCIYIKGNKNILNQNMIGIIGCRQASEYGIKAAKYFSYNLSKKGIIIVSGLAKGIDSFSHIGTIEANGKTIAVVGNSLDIVYPKENYYLEKQIIQKEGAIISEYPLGVEPEKINFPARNRIISGISKGVIVVEAKKKSGTLITVDFALEQGRDVYVVPGNINSINSVGTNDLIKQGARLVTNYEDIEV